MSERRVMSGNHGSPAGRATDASPGADWFPGATSVSRLRVYDWPTIDGLRGGSPHLHTVSSEGYIVLGGTGTLQTLSAAGYAEHRLSPGTVLWFTPGTVHRLVTDDDNLDILVVMQNAGLPEAGDAVLTFPPEVLLDPAAYARAAALVPAADMEAGPQYPAGQYRSGQYAGGQYAAVDPDAARAQAARERRDLAMRGYLDLREQVRARGGFALDGLYRAAAALVHRRVEDWSRMWRDRALAQAERTGRQLDQLAAGRVDHLATSAVYTVSPAPLGFGMCGRLQTWDFAGAVAAKGSATPDWLRR
jgi:mannose-6-phosphate isomerase-like protein (cupin superfamily)